MSRDLEAHEHQSAPVRAIAARVRSLRRRRGWTAEQLGEQMTASGVRWDRFAVTKLETGKRQSVSVDEFLTLAYVLDVAPVHLLVPIEDAEQGPYRVVPNEPPVPSELVRAWIRGEQVIGNVDERRFRTEVPPSEFRVEPFGATQVGSDRRPRRHGR